SPAAPGINVNGQDPTASDTLIVNGTTGQDTVGYAPSATIGAGAVTVNALPTVNFTTIEHLNYFGQGGNDNLTVTTPDASDRITFTPGAGVGDGTLEFQGGDATALVPLIYSHIDSGSINPGTVTFAKAGGARADLLTVNGTNNSDAFFLDDF